MALIGLAHSETSIENRTVIVNTGLRGVLAMGGVTEMGPIGMPTLIGSWSEYSRIFGGLIAGDDFPLYCRRALDAGARLLVCRIGHYTDITDPATLAGVKATITLGTGGNTAVFTAKNVGPWANGAIVKSTVAQSGIAGMLDISFTFPNNSAMNQVVRNVKATGQTTADKTKFNAESNYIDIGATAGTLVPGTATLAAGAQVIADIVAADYIGDVVGTGMHAFDQYNNFVKLAFPAKADNDIDAALSLYLDPTVGGRAGIIGVFRPPIGLTDSGANDYREGTGAYAGNTVIDNYNMMGVYGDLDIKHPITQVPMVISGIADAMACGSRRDNSEPDQYKSAAGSKRGRIFNTQGVVYNVGTPGRKLNADNLVLHGWNPIIDHEVFGVVLWGDTTMTKAYYDTMLRQLTVMEFLNSLLVGLKPLIDGELFEPNHPNTWKAVYRKVRELMLIAASKGAVQGEEGQGWLFQGDQDVMTANQAVMTSPQDIAAQRYTPTLFVKPTGALLYIGLKLAVTDTSVDFTVDLSQPGS